MYSSQRNVFKKATLSAAIAPILLTGASVHAQEGKTLQLEEVVVSAQRKTESLQDVPIAVAALSTDELTEKGILDTESLGQAVPGLVISTQDGRFFPRLRGVGNSLVSAGYESGIATYVDGVYYASATTGSMVLSNVERIEVIKGPQGTLFGRNATGGLIQVVTKKPEHEFGGDISMSVANYDTVTATGYVTGGINDKVAADFAFHYAEQGEGWGTNLANGRDVYRQDDELVLRTALLINPSDRTEIRLAADMNESNGSMSAIQPIKGFNFYPFLNAQEIKNDYDISADLHPESNYEGSGLSAHIEHELGSVIFTSITAVRESELYYTNDTETTRTPFVNLIFAQKDEQISQEFQLASNNDSDLSWVAGVYYFDGESKFDPFHVYLYGLASAGAGGLEEQILYPVLNNEAYAVYGQGTYSLTADTSLTLGIRSSEEERAIESSETLVVTGVGTLPSTPLPEKSEDYSKVTYRVAIDHAFNEQMMGYISYNTGFKSGGYNASNYSSQIDTEPYDPENIEAWEVGLKSDLFDNRLRLNTAVFFYNYEDCTSSEIFGC